ncbi:hypothetical protein BGW39_007422 [Mortierella sp. 14UC]|nr:hypothetical protein BGW39_007422 [Mortierella sp. 14UC]
MADPSNMIIRSTMSRVQLAEQLVLMNHATVRDVIIAMVQSGHEERWNMQMSKLLQFDRQQCPEL